MAYFINYWKFNEIRKYNHEHANVSQQEHVFPSLQFMHVRLAPYGRRISKESLLLKKEC